mmetsp:Transcript_22745/g.51822  ORF Transcript_22745/g.51822 Transcript_22745/m.51822 type:complete len:200 (+) Transcript_22745:36-635(+)
MFAQKFAQATKKAKDEGEARRAKIVKDVVAFVERECLRAASKEQTVADIPTLNFEQLRCDMRPEDLQRRVFSAFEEGGCTAVASSVWLWRISWPENPPNPVRGPAGNVRGKCPVCHETSLLVSLVPCGHSVCHGCSEQYAKQICPSCRGGVTRCIPMFVDEVVGSEQSSKRRRVEEVRSAGPHAGPQTPRVSGSGLRGR